MRAFTWCWAPMRPARAPRWRRSPTCCSASGNPPPTPSCTTCRSCASARRSPPPTAAVCPSGAGRATAGPSSTPPRRRSPTTRWRRSSADCPGRSSAGPSASTRRASGPAGARWSTWRARLARACSRRVRACADSRSCRRHSMRRPTPSSPRAKPSTGPSTKPWSVTRRHGGRSASGACAPATGGRSTTRSPRRPRSLRRCGLSRRPSRWRAPGWSGSSASGRSSPRSTRWRSASPPRPTSPMRIPPGSPVSGPPLTRAAPRKPRRCGPKPRVTGPGARPRRYRSSRR